MKCSQCGTDILSGNTCPNCGALNIPFNAPQTPTPPAQQPVVQQPVQQTSVVQQPVTPQPVQTAPVAPQVTQSQIVPQNATEAIENLGIDETGTDEQVNITANMAAPTLAVNEENLTANVENISATDDATYDPNDTSVVSTPENAKPESNVVTFDIPPVNKENTNTSAPTTGIQEVATGTTVGDASAHELTPVKPKKGFTLKINLSSKSNLVYFGVIILALVAGIVIGKTFFSKTIQSNNYGIVNQQKKIQTVADGKNGETLVNGYKFKIPTSYAYDKNQGGIFIYDADATYRAYMRVYDGTYDEFAKAIESIKATLQDSGVVVNDSKELKVGEKNYLLIEITTELQNRLIAYTNAIDDKIVYVEIIGADNNYKYDPLEGINDILINTEAIDKVNSLEKLDVFDKYGLIKKTSDSYKEINNAN